MGDLIDIPRARRAYSTLINQVAYDFYRLGYRWGPNFKRIRNFIKAASTGWTHETSRPATRQRKATASSEDKVGLESKTYLITHYLNLEDSLGKRFLQDGYEWDWKKSNGITTANFTVFLVGQLRSLREPPGIHKWATLDEGMLAPASRQQGSVVWKVNRNYCYVHRLPITSMRN